MIEVLWHGRGGQGAFTAARLLGAAASLADGRHALAFPAFGPERRGAPIRAFTKMADEPVGNRSAIAKADYVVYLDDTLLGEGWDGELKPGGMVLVNSTRAFDDERIVALDADGISSAVLGRPIPNTVFLGALAALCDRVSIEDVEEAIRQYMPAKLHEKNLAIVRKAMEAVGHRPEQAQLPTCHLEQVPLPICHPERAQRVEGSSASATESAPTEPRRPDAHIPTLRTGALDPEKFARSTCFEAGYLTVKNAGWRNMRPVIDAASCTGCLQCYFLCPDGTVFKVGEPAAEGAPVAIDYDFCKGCGVCAKACRFGSITMIPESEADAQHPRHPARSTEGAKSKDPARRQPAGQGTQRQESEADAR